MRKMGTAGIIIEKITTGTDAALEMEQKAITQRLGADTRFESFKITFLDVYPIGTQNLDTNFLDNHVLGYVTIINVHHLQRIIRSYVFDSVIRELGCKSPENCWQPLSGHYLHVQRSFLCRLADAEYNLTGSYFTQQNGITSVCSHACLCMMLNNSQHMDLIVHSEDINHRLDIDHATHKIYVRIANVAVNNGVTYKGPTVGELIKVAKHYGFDTHIRPLKSPIEGPNFREFVYGFIESGFPALFSFGTDGVTEEKGFGGDGDQHVVAVVGHTLNSNSWFPLAFKTYVRNGRSPARYLSSLAWVDNFLVNDDNVGMQLNLPAHSFQKIDSFTHASNSFTPCIGMGIIPKSYKIRFLAHHAERLVSDFLAKYHQAIGLSSSDYYVEHLLKHCDSKKHTVVLRTSLVSKHDYIQHLKADDNHGGKIIPDAIEKIAASLFGHNWFWLTELSEPDLYVGNRAKVIDILMNAQAPINEKTSQGEWNKEICLIKAPDVALLNAGMDVNQELSFERVELQLTAHSSLIGVSSGSPELVW